MRKTIGIVGLGLIGGSFALALKAYTEHTVLGIDTDEKVLSYAKTNGYIDGYSKNIEETLAMCDIVVISLYPKDTLVFLKEREFSFQKDAIVADFCGVKEMFADFHSSHFNYIGCHPMAGKELSGILNAEKDLFAGASMLMMTSHPDLEEIYRKVGFSRIVHTTPSHHDRLISYTSQLPHVLAVAYVLLQEFEECDGYHAGSFHDVSRVARINEVLWSELFCANQELLSKQIDGLTKNLNELKEMINHHPEKLRSTLRQARIRMEEKDGAE